MALSFLTLFLELALIRWLGENIVFLSYFTNFVLLGSFLGIGLGFLHADRRPRFHWLPGAVLAVVALAMLLPVRVSRTGSDIVFFGSIDISGTPIWVMLPLVFLGATAVLYLVGQAVAQTFVLFEPLEAYRLDLIGSILGILGFSIISWARMPPLIWGLVVAGLITWLGRESIDGRGNTLLVGMLLLLGVQTFTPGYSWSPYYRVSASATDDVVLVSVNGIPHQTITSTARRRLIEPIYGVPFELTRDIDLDRVLIVGAGTGTDVALALEAGAGQVDAVEIDPTIYSLGLEKHPDQPYSDQRVSVVIDDGRAFMQRATPGYDLIVFALPDSLTLVAGQAGLRLESYLFTQEALDAAVELLDSDGVFTMYNYYTTDWLVDRLANTVWLASGTPTCVIAPEGSTGLALIASGGAVESICPGLLQAELTNAPVPATDDLPFLYVQERGIPQIYLLAMASILITSLLLLRWSGLRKGSVRSNLDLFLMGVAFLLLETKSVVQFALWFGTTWAVNAMVFTGVLVAVLAAVETARRTALPRPAVLYGGLIVSIGGAWAIPPSALLELPGPARLVAAVALTFAPIFLANLVFAQRFKEAANSADAFGVNLLGAMVGGILEYVALASGYRALSIVVGVVYVLAYVGWQNQQKQVVQTTVLES